MGYLIYSLIGLIGSASLVSGVIIFIRARAARQSGSATGEIVLDIVKTTKQLQEQPKYLDSYLSKGILTQLAQQAETAQAELEKEKGTLKEVEGKLDAAQKNVETRELSHQALKTAKEEDEQRLQELMNAFGSISSESVSLEHKLAASLKNLDQMSTEVEITDDQKLVLTELSSALLNAGSRLRELILEYNSVNERLTMLQQQHNDLEEEYTRLVEQQLGE